MFELFGARGSVSPKDCGEAARSNPVFQELCHKGAKRQARAGGPGGQVTRYAGLRGRKAAWVKEAQGGCTRVVPAAAIPTEGRRSSSQGGRQMAGPAFPRVSRGARGEGLRPHYCSPARPRGHFP